MGIYEEIEKHVAEGLVLDDHGQWITIARKIEKEKVFLSHVENGDILIDGKWIPISQAVSIKKAGSAHSHTDEPNVNQSGDLPEVAADGSFPPETVYAEIDYQPESIETETDFPPETAILTIEENTSTGQKSFQGDLPPSIPSEELHFSTHENEIHNETISFNVSMLAAHAASQEKASEETSESACLHHGVEGEDVDAYDKWERAKRKRQTTLLIISITAAVLAGAGALLAVHLL